MATPAKAVLQVSGFLESKAAADGDTNKTIQSLISFLERKASPRGQHHKVLQSHLQDDSSLLIEIDATTISRFTHLDGFSFSGAIIQVKPYTDSQSRSRDQPRIQAYNQPQDQTRQPSAGALADRVSRPPTKLQSQNPFSKPDRHVSNQQRQSSFQPQNNQPHNQSQTQTTTVNGPTISRPPVQGGRFNDLDGIGERFLRAFFPLYDSNREEALKNFYDDDSRFSFSVQLRSRRLKSAVKRQACDWSPYIKLSRNIAKLNHPNARARRLFKGQHDIYETWTQLPKTQHPSLETQLTQWVLECAPLISLPDATGNSAVGVTGLMVAAHGAFEDVTGKGEITRRAFDRIFILGPGAGVGGIRVLSDMLVIRQYTGSYGSLYASRPVTPVIIHPEVTPGSGVGEPRPGKSQEQLMKEQMVLQLSFTTKLKLVMSEQCLEMNSWNMQAALANTKQLAAEGKLGPDVFLNV